MNIAILGLGVIGTTYGFIFQQSGHNVEHLVRNQKRDSSPTQLSVHLLDGRYNQKGEEKDDTYEVAYARPDTNYDLIVVSVASGALQGAVDTISENRLGGTILLFCNFWNTRAEIDSIMGARPYIIGFPTAGGHLDNQRLNGALFDHIMLESREKANIPNYADLLALLESADLKAEIPHDMPEWIWLHMAINAGVTSTAAQHGDLSDPRRLALNLMADAHALAEAVRTIRETVKVVSARGVDLHRYRDELLPYRIPAWIAGAAMKKMFASNELTRRIMTLHSDVRDILYGCECVYRTAREKHVDAPRYLQKMDDILAGSQAAR